MKKIWIILIIIIGVIIVLGVGYGFLAGAQTKKFSQNMDKTFKASQEKWKVSQLTNPPGGSSENPTEVKEFYTKVQNDSNDALSQINKSFKTYKAKNLRSDLKTYYTLSKKASDNGIILVNYTLEMEKLASDMSPTLSSSDPNQLAQQLTDYKAKVDSHIAILQSIPTTPSIKEMNAAFIDALTEISKLLEQTITYAKNNQMDQIESQFSQFDAAMKKFSDMKQPTSEEMKKDILTKSEEDQMNSLNSKIPNEISSLKNVVFGF